MSEIHALGPFNKDLRPEFMVGLEMPGNENVR